MDHDAPPRWTFWRTVRQDHPDYVRWFIADTASTLGSALISVPISLASLHVTGSLSQAGVVGAVTATGSMIMTIPAGMIIDNFNKKTLLACHGIIQALIWGVFALLLFFELFNFPLLVLFGACSGLASGAFGGLTNAVLRFVISENLYVQAQGKNQTRDSVIWLAGLPLGGFLFGIAPSLPFFFQSVLGLGPLYASRSISRPLPGARSGEKYAYAEFWQDMRYSLAWIWRYPLIRSLFTIDIFSNFANFFLIAAIDLWLAYLGVAGWIIGLCSAMFTVGMILGGLLQDKLIALFPGRRIIRVGMAWELFWYLFLLAFSQHWPLIAVAAFATVIPSVARNSYAGGFMALSAPPEKLGKCSAGARFIVSFLPIIASASAGTILGLIGFRWSMVLCAVVSLIAFVLASRTLLSQLPLASEFDTIPVCD